MAARGAAGNVVGLDGRRSLRYLGVGDVVNRTFITRVGEVYRAFVTRIGCVYRIFITKYCELYRTFITFADVKV